MGARPPRGIDVACHRVGTALAVAYVPLVGVIAAIRAHMGSGAAAWWATSPALVDHGALWTLFSSALVLDHVHWVQLLAATGLTWALLRRDGPGALWSAMLLGHVGSTLVAYAGVGVLWETGARRHAAEIAPDFGISCVWRTLLALLLCGVVLRGARRHRADAWPLVLLAGVLYAVVAIGTATSIAAAEHAGAIVAGIATGLWTCRAVRSGRPLLERSGIPHDPSAHGLVAASASEADRGA